MAQFGQNWLRFSQNLARWNWLANNFPSKILKIHFFNFFFKNRNKLFRGEKSTFCTFCPSKPLDDLPLSTPRKNYLFYFIISLVEISLAVLKLTFFAFYRNEIGPLLSKNGQNDVIVGLKWPKMSVYQTFSPNYVLTFYFCI